MSPKAKLLRGRLIFWTGLKGSAEAIVDALLQKGAKVERHPLLLCEIVPDISLGPLRKDSWIIFSSARAAEAILGLPRPSAKIAAVGPSTVRMLRRAGWRTDLTPKNQSAEALAEALVSEVAEPGNALFLKGDKALPAIPDRLRAAGFTIEERVVYRTFPAPPAVLSRTARKIRLAADAVLLGSPAGVSALASAVSIKSLAADRPFLIWAALGKTTGDALLRAGVSRPAVARSPAPDDVIRALETASEKLSALS